MKTKSVLPTPTVTRFAGNGIHLGAFLNKESFKVGVADGLPVAAIGGFICGNLIAVPLGDMRVRILSNGRVFKNIEIACCCRAAFCIPIEEVFGVDQFSADAHFE